MNRATRTIVATIGIMLALTFLAGFQYDVEKRLAEI